jgi:PAS domain S-box-containing protein
VTLDSRTVELRLRAAVESAPSGLLMVDPEGKIVLVNREVERLFGYAREELLGKPVELLVPEAFRRHHLVDRAGFFAHPKVRAMGAGRDLFGRRKDGLEVPVEIGLTPVVTEEGLFVLSSIVDISERKRAEEQRRLLEEQLRQAQKMEAVGTLAGGIAHDFNNILGAILAYAEMVERDVDEPLRSDLREILRAADRGKRLVQHILLFSRRQALQRLPVSLEQSVAESLTLLRPTLPGTVSITIHADPATPRVLADPTSVHQVLMNLVTNSAQAMPEGGSVEVRLEPFYVQDHMARKYPDLREGPHVLLAVRDSGPGMDTAVRERAFDPFFTTKSSGEGTGLGLAVVHGIMREHAGVVELESEPGRGTEVRCFFPAIDSPETGPGSAAERSLPQGRGQRILFVEDQRSLAAVNERRLEDLGYTPTAVTDARQALALVQDAGQQFDLLVTDYSMPHLTGVELARAASAARPGLPILLLTGYVEEMAEGTLRSAGISEVLRKPVTVAELADAVARHVGA